MSDKLKKLKLDLLLKELKLLESEEEYIDEFTNHYKPIFMDELAKNGYKPKIITGDTSQTISDSRPKNVVEVDDEETKIIKFIFRAIAKISHPDKTKNIYKNKLYEQAQIAYNVNDLLTLYKVAKKLNIDVEINIKTLSLVERIVEGRKKDLKNVESSFLWQWVNEPNDDKKLELINQFIKKHG